MASSRATTSKTRSWKPAAPYRLVAVEWEDSQRPAEAWEWLDEYAIPDAIRCLSVGFLVAETDQAIALAPNLGDIACARAQACGIIRISTSAIRQMADL